MRHPAEQIMSLPGARRRGGALAPIRVVLALTAALALSGPLPGLPGQARAGSILPAIEAARQRTGSTAYDIDKHYVRVGDNAWIAVKGRRERRQVRYSRLWATWSDDQRRVATELGFPVNRLLELETSRTRETWSYPAQGLIIVFDDAGHLVDRHIG